MMQNISNVFLYTEDFTDVGIIHLKKTKTFFYKY